MTAPLVNTFRLSALHSVSDQMGVKTIQLRAEAMGRTHGFDNYATERVGKVAEEMASNIVRHAGKGQVILRCVGEPGVGCIEILALDKGPGIGNMNRAMRDAGSASDAGRANGLPGVRRLADLFDIFSFPGAGTAVVAHVGAAVTDDTNCPCGESAMRGHVGAVCVPVHGEIECGDAWAIEFLAQSVVVMVADGLGHGPEAAAAANAAMAVFHEDPGADPEDMFVQMNSALHSTRGAAISIAVVNQSKRTVRFCGIGNSEARITAIEANRHLVPQNGIVGHNMPRLQCTDIPWPPGARLVMQSDGIASRWRADRYPGLLARHPALLAGVLFRDFGRPRDDATVVVVRDPRMDVVIG